MLRLLHDCLKLAAQPPALRLFVLSALSSDRHRAPAALEQALAYYERPGRAAIIQSARARCVSAPEARESRPADANGSSSFEVDKAADARAAAAPSTRRRRVVVAVGVCAGAVAAAMVTLLYSHGWPTGNIGNVQDLAAYVADTGRGLVDAVTKTLIPPPAAPETSAVADATSPGPAKKLRRGRASVTSVSPEQPAATGEIIAAADGKAIQLVADETPAAGANSVVDAALADSPEAGAANPAAVVETNEIMPPRLIDPVQVAAMGLRRNHSVVSCDRTHDLRDRQGGSRATDFPSGPDDGHDDAQRGEDLDVRARVAERASYALYADAERCDNALSVAHSGLGTVEGPVGCNSGCGPGERHRGCLWGRF